MSGDYIVEESRVSWMINSGGMRTVCPCVSRLTGSASQTQAKRQECYLLVSHHIKGMSGHYSPWECVTDINCSLSLPTFFFSWNCPSTDSRKTKRKWEELGRRKTNRGLSPIATANLWAICYDMMMLWLSLDDIMVHCCLRGSSATQKKNEL